MHVKKKLIEVIVTCRFGLFTLMWNSVQTPVAVRPTDIFEAGVCRKPKKRFDCATIKPQRNKGTTGARKCIFSEMHIIIKKKFNVANLIKLCYNFFLKKNCIFYALNN